MSLLSPLCIIMLILKGMGKDASIFNYLYLTLTCFFFPLKSLGRICVVSKMKIGKVHEDPEVN